VKSGIGSLKRLIGVSVIALVMTCGRLPAKETPSEKPRASPSSAADADAKLYDQSHIGPLADGRVIVPTNQILSPAGKQLIVGGRPVDVALSPDKKWLAVLNVVDVQLIEVESRKTLSRVSIRGGSFKGIVFAPDGKRVYASSMKGGIVVLKVSADGKLSAAKPIARYPSGWRFRPTARRCLPRSISKTRWPRSIWRAVNLSVKFPWGTHLMTSC
jgi:hypothetical protein